MSPQVINRKEYSKKTDVWSLGLVFIELITLEPHKVDPTDFESPLQPSSIAISDDRLKPIRKCICLKMVVLRDQDRCSVKEVIADEAFRNHFPFVDAKAKAWLYDEALVEMENQQLELKIVDVENKLRQNLAEKQKQIDETQRELDEMKKQMDEERQERRKMQKSLDKSNELISNLQKRVEKLEAQKQNQQNQPPVGERFQAEFEILKNQNKELEQKLQSLEQRWLANDEGNGRLEKSRKNQPETSEKKKKLRKSTNHQVGNVEFCNPFSLLFFIFFNKQTPIENQLSKEMQAKLNLTKEQVDMESQVCFEFVSII